MDILLRPINPKHLPEIKREMQEAFQQGYESVYGAYDQVVLPEQDINQSLQAEGAIAYEAIRDGQRVGGTIVNINHKTQHNHLELLYVRSGCQNQGVGKGIWKALEALYPETQVWGTLTPYFEIRNIHFYINQCGFHIVEFFNQRHPDPKMLDNDALRDGMFRFEKHM